VRGDAEGGEGGLVAAGAGEDGGEAAVEGPHEGAGGAGEEPVTEEVVDVGGEVGVVDAEDGDAEATGREEAGEADGAGGGDVDGVGSEGAGAAQH